jgi:type II secretory pathway component PulF
MSLHMAQFKYEARNKQGQEVRGQVEADNRLQASVKLRESELWILRLEPAGGAARMAAPGGQIQRERTEVAAADWRFGVRAVRAAPLRDFFSQLAELLNSGVSVYEALTALPDRVTPRLRPVLKAISPALAEGQPLSDQLARYPHLFSRVTVGMIRAGERSGNIGQMAGLLADQYQQDHSIWLSLLLPRIYGAIVIFFALLVPSLPQIIARGSLEKGADWGWYVHHLLYFLLPIIVGLFILDQIFRWFLHQPWAQGIRADLAYYLPGAAGYVRPAMYARVLIVMEAMVKSGASFADALSLAADAAGPGVLGRQLSRAAAQVLSGVPLGTAMNAVTKLPFNARSALLTAEHAGAQEQTLNRLARTQLEAMEAAPRRVAVVGGLVGGAIFAIIAGVAIAYGYKNYFEALLTLGDKMMPK